MRRFLLLSALVLLGCSDPLGPGDISGIYVLVRYEGSTLPASVTEHGRTIRVTSGTIVLRTNGTARIMRSATLDDATAEIRDFDLFYERHGHELRWDSPVCPPGANCVTSALQVPLTVIGDRLVSASEFGLEYVRQDDPF